MLDFRLRDLGDRCLQREQVVVPGRLMIAAFCLDHHAKQTGLLHLAIVSAQRPEQFGAAHLEIHQVVSMVENAHGVGFWVTDSDLDLMFS